jgi:hypothetical protein
MPRDHRTHLAARLVPAIFAILLVACGNAATSSAPGDATIPPDSTPGPVGSGLGAFPGVEGFAYREEPGIVPGFVEGAEESLAGAAELAIVQAAVASRGEEEVSVIAFGFPGTEDTKAVDALARIIDGLEDALQTGAERGLDGEAYVLTSEGRSVVLAPWGRTDLLVFLFFAGPTEATQDLAAAILNAVD